MELVQEKFQRGDLEWRCEFHLQVSQQRDIFWTFISVPMTSCSDWSVVIKQNVAFWRLSLYIGNGPRETFLSFHYTASSANVGPVLVLCVRSLVRWWKMSVGIQQGMNCFVSLSLPSSPSFFSCHPVPSFSQHFCPAPNVLVIRVRGS
jgi:hypothetical protein